MQLRQQVPHNPKINSYLSHTNLTNIAHTHKLLYLILQILEQIHAACINIIKISLPFATADTYHHIENSNQLESTVSSNHSNLSNKLVTNPSYTTDSHLNITAIHRMIARENL